MSETNPAPLTGPPMICATGAIKTGPARIGHIAGNINLPRTVTLTSLIAVGGGALLGLLAATAIPGSNPQKWVFSAGFGALVGWFLTTYSPLRGESMSKWLGLQVTTLRRQRMVNGKPVVVAVGSTLSARETMGAFKLVRTCVHVPAGAYDERGVLRTPTNRNATLDPAATAGSVEDISVRHQPRPEDLSGPSRRPHTAPPGPQGTLPEPHSAHPQPAGVAPGAGIVPADHQAPAPAANPLPASAASPIARPLAHAGPAVPGAPRWARADQPAETTPTGPPRRGFHVRKKP